MRKFVFTADKPGRTDFMIVYESVRQIDPEKATKDERPYIAAMLRTLDRISVPFGEAPKDADEYTIDSRPRKLHGDDDQVIEISQKLHDKVIGWVDNGKFLAGAIVAVEDFGARWAQAEKFERNDDGEPAAAGVARKRK